MVFGFGKKQSEVTQVEADPTLIWQFTKDIKILPEESWGAWGLRTLNNIAVSGQNMNTIRVSGPSRAIMAGVVGGATGIALNAATNPSFRVTGKVGGNLQHQKAPEIKADAFVLTTKMVKGLLGDEVVLEGLYDPALIAEKVTGVDKRNKEILRTGVPQPDKGAFYSQTLLNRIYNIEDELVPKGFVSSIDVLTGISAEEGRLGGKKFKLSIAKIELPIEIINLKTEKKASFLKTVGQSYGFGKGKDAGAEYSLQLRNELDDTAKVANFDVHIGDKDDKKKGLDIAAKMAELSEKVQVPLRQTISENFETTDKKDVLRLTKRFKDRFYS